jgi:integrase
LEILDFLGIDMGRCFIIDDSIALRLISRVAIISTISCRRCNSRLISEFNAPPCILMLANAHGIVHEMMLTALRTGMRQGEIRGLQWSSVDWQNQSAAVRHSRCDYSKALESTKNSRERHIPLDLDLYEALYKRKQATGYVFNRREGSAVRG